MDGEREVRNKIEWKTVLEEKKKLLPFFLVQQTQHSIADVMLRNLEIVEVVRNPSFHLTQERVIVGC